MSVFSASQTPPTSPNTPPSQPRIHTLVRFDTAGNPVFVVNLVTTDGSPSYPHVVRCADALCNPNRGDIGIFRLPEDTDGGLGPSETARPVLVHYRADTDETDILLFDQIAQRLVLWVCQGIACSTAEHAEVASGVLIPRTGVQQKLRPAVSADGVLAVVYGTTDGLVLLHCEIANCAATATSRTAVSSSSFQTGTNVGMAAVTFTGTGEVTVAYTTGSATDSEAYVIGCQLAGACTAPRNFESDVGGMKQLTVTTGADGLPLLTWHGSRNWIYMVDCHDVACSAGTERVLEADTDGDTGGTWQYFGHESLDYVAFDADGRPLIVFAAKNTRSVRQLRHHFGPFLRGFSSTRPTHAVCYALFSSHTHRMRIGACCPML